MLTLIASCNHKATAINAQYFVSTMVLFVAYQSVCACSLRIERLWRDLWFGCVVLFHGLFSDMEAQGDLDIGSDTDLCALQYVYVPWIQIHLDQFVSAMINRPLRTERNKTLHFSYGFQDKSWIPRCRWEVR